MTLATQRASSVLSGNPSVTSAACTIASGRPAKPAFHLPLTPTLITNLSPFPRHAMLSATPHQPLLALFRRELNFMIYRHIGGYSDRLQSFLSKIFKKNSSIFPVLCNVTPSSQLFISLLCNESLINNLRPD